MKIKSIISAARNFPFFVPFCLLGILPGCFQAQSVHQYTLTVEQPAQTPSRQNAPLTFLVGPVKLASHLDQPRIIRRHGNTRIEAIASRQWAGNLREMISNKLVAELSTQCGPFPVFSYPAAAVITQGKRVAVDILRFEGTDDQDAAIEARWTLFNLEDRSIIQTQTTLIRIPCSDNNYETLVTALSQGLTELSRQIAQSMVTIQ
jgi:uncharacterized lipoprotein YmbA